jgi:hypothetical protein
MPDVPKQRKLSPREEAMNAVAQVRNADFTKETGIEIVGNIATIDPDIDPEAAEAEAERARLAAAADGEPVKTPEEIAAEAADAQQRALEEQGESAEDKAAREAQEATARASTTAADPKAKIKLRVNGADVEITYEEAQRRLQKDVSADQRLEEASRVMREANALQLSLQEQQRLAQEAAEAARTGGNKDGVVIDPAATKKFTSALFKGDEEAATLAFNEAVSSAVKAAQKDNTGRGNATPVDPSAIATQVRQQIAIDSALENSRASYPDLYADPDIEAVAASKIQRKVAEGVPFITALDEVQGDMAKKFGWKPKAGTFRPAANTDRREEKLARKESLDQPVGGPRSVKTVTTDEVQAPVSDTIREMAKARGQQLV